MRRIRIGVLVLAAFVASCRNGGSDPAPDPSPSATAVEWRATLNGVSGEVRIKPVDGADYLAAHDGRKLRIGDVITTGAKGHATITFRDGSAAVVLPRSLVTIEPPANSVSDGLGVQRGRVDVEIRSGLADFRVTTPGVEASTRADADDGDGKDVVR